jgi:hypothetical protein
LLARIQASDHVAADLVRCSGASPRGRTPEQVNKNFPGLRNLTREIVHMTGMRSNTAAIYLRKSTEDDGKSVGQQERTLRNKAEDLDINIVAVYREDEDEAGA